MQAARHLHPGDGLPSWCSLETALQRRAAPPCCALLPFPLPLLPRHPPAAKRAPSGEQAMLVPCRQPSSWCRCRQRCVRRSHTYTAGGARVCECTVCVRWVGGGGGLRGGRCVAEAAAAARACALAILTGYQGKGSRA